jgi:hypothetical protein
MMDPEKNDTSGNDKLKSDCNISGGWYILGLSATQSSDSQPLCSSETLVASQRTVQELYFSYNLHLLIYFFVFSDTRGKEMC